jgi:hypothetical protein
MTTAPFGEPIGQKEVRFMDQMKSGGTATMTGSPVDNATYNLIKALGEKLEAIEAYRKYEKDGGSGARIFRQLGEEDARHAEQLLDALRQQLGSR